jgi:alkylation response protein AidB-like acyl-CoA dehydrogenase
VELSWADSDQRLVDRARSFAGETLVPRRDRSGFDHAAWMACASEGLLALPLDTAWHGDARSLKATAGAYEALGRGGADRGLLFVMGAHLFGCALPIARLGTPAQCGQYARGLSDGTVIAALAVTEAGGGTTAAQWTTRVERDETGYRLSGEKVYVTNAPVAGVFLVLAREGDGPLGLTALLVPRDTPGLRVEPLEPTLGLRGAPMGRVLLADCRLPAGAVLGVSSAGLCVLQACLRYERTCILAGLLGAAARDLAACVARTTARHGADGPLLRYQAVGHRLARMHCRIEAARGVLYRGAEAIDRGVAAAHDPAVVKLTVSEALVACAVDVMQTFAGAGWIGTDDVGGGLADAIGSLSASGTSDAQLNTIAAALPRLYA